MPWRDYYQRLQTSENARGQERIPFDPNSEQTVVHTNISLHSSPETTNFSVIGLMPTEKKSGSKEASFLSYPLSVFKLLNWSLSRGLEIPSRKVPRVWTSLSGFELVELHMYWKVYDRIARLPSDWTVRSPWMRFESLVDCRKVSYVAGKIAVLIARWYPRERIADVLKLVESYWLRNLWFENDRSLRLFVNEYRLN